MQHSQKIPMMPSIMLFHKIGKLKEPPLILSKQGRRRSIKFCVQPMHRNKKDPVDISTRSINPAAPKRAKLLILLCGSSIIPMGFKLFDASSAKPLCFAACFCKTFHLAMGFAKRCDAAQNQACGIVPSHWGLFTGCAACRRSRAAFIMKQWF